MRARSVLLLDEPDAHLEILRQRQVYQLLAELASDHRCQVIAASHSEVLLNEAARRDVVVAFVGKPHRIDNRGSQVLKALKDIGFEQYYQAEQTGWVLYVEGSTDLAILRAFAHRLGHHAQQCLERPFVYYVGNQPREAERHFHGLREAKSDLVGFALFDRLGNELPDNPNLQMYQWKNREIENYLCQRETLLAYAEDCARQTAAGPIFEGPEVERWCSAMESSIEDYIPPAASRDPNDRWWRDTKISDEYLDRVFEAFYDRLKLPNLTRKTDYHVLAEVISAELIVPEINEVLDSIADTACRAHPRVE